MGLLRRKWLWLLLLALGIPALLLLDQHWRSGRRLSAWKQARQAEGERFLVSEVRRPPPVGESNPFQELVAAGEAIRHRLWQAGQWAPPVCRYAAPGRALSLEGLTSWPVPLRMASRPGQPGPESPGDLALTWEDLAAALAPLDQPLFEARRLLQQPGLHARLQYEAGWSLSLAHLAVLRDFASGFRSGALLELHAGRLEPALDQLEALLDTVRLLEPEQMVHSQSEAHLLAQIAFGCTWEALQSHGWTDLQLARLQEHWQALRFLEPAVRSLEMERAVLVACYQRARLSTAFAAQLIRFPGSAGLPQPGEAAQMEAAMAGMVESPDGFLTQVVLLPVWQFLSASGDELDLLRGAQVALEAGRAALRAGHSQALRESGPQLQAWRSRSRSLARLRHQASSLAPAGADRFLSRAAAQESIRELVVTAIALERFRLSQGRPPEQLIDLVPRFLAAPPRDFGSGGAFRYRLLPEGRFLLYGVGADGTDDGGQAESISKDHSLPNLTPLTTRDMVWPAACSPGEARAVRATLWEDPAAWAAP